MNRLLIIVTLVFVLSACTNKTQNRLDIDVSKVSLGNFKIHPYGKDLFSIDTTQFEKELKPLSSKYPYFLGNVFEDQAHISQLRNYVCDPKLRLLNDKINRLDFEQNLSIELSNALKHYIHYYPELNLPKVYSYISGLYFEQAIILNEEALILALDLYLGPDFEAYQQMGIPTYKRQRMHADYLVVDCMKEFALIHNIPQNTSSNFLSEIIYHGKTLYFLDAMMPQKADHFKIGYSKEQLQWCINNESQIWSLFIEEELLFSSDFERIRKFITDGPFTQSISREAPAALGIWIGWQIVRSFMDKNPEVSLQDLLKLHDAQQILNQSGYKPKR